MRAASTIRAAFLHTAVGAAWNRDEDHAVSNNACWYRAVAGRRSKRLPRQQGRRFYLPLAGTSTKIPMDGSAMENGVMTDAPTGCRSILVLIIVSAKARHEATPPTGVHTAACLPAVPRAGSVKFFDSRPGRRHGPCLPADERKSKTFNAPSSVRSGALIGVADGHGGDRRVHACQFFYSPIGSAGLGAAPEQKTQIKTNKFSSWRGFCCDGRDARPGACKRSARSHGGGHGQRP